MTEAPIYAEAKEGSEVDRLPLDTQCLRTRDRNGFTRIGYGKGKSGWVQTSVLLTPAEHDKILADRKAAEEKRLREQQAAEQLAAAQEAVRTGDWSTAETQANEALGNNPDLAGAKDLAEQARRKLNAAEAAKKFKEAVALYNKEEYHDASDRFAEVAALDPEYPGLKSYRNKLQWKMLNYFTSDPIGLAISGFKQEGRKVIFWAGVINNTTAVQHVNPNDFTIVDTNDYSYSHSSDTYRLNRYFDAVDLQPGMRANGWLVFYVSGNAHVSRIIYRGWGGQAEKYIPEY